MYWASSCHSEARSAEESPEGDRNLGKTLYHHPGILQEIDFYRAVALKSHFASFRMTFVLPESRQEPLPASRQTPVILKREALKNLQRSGEKFMVL